MARSKVTVSLKESTFDRLDRLVKIAVFPNRIQAIQIAVEEKLLRRDLRESRGAAWLGSAPSWTLNSRSLWPTRACRRIFLHGPAGEPRSYLLLQLDAVTCAPGREGILGQESVHHCLRRSQLAQQLGWTS